MDRYEISLWEDYPDTTEQGIPFLNERKLCVIGSDTMLSRARALEPKLITNVNGTHTFTFKMYYKYIDELTGEDIVNPFSSLLINERKVKVYWKDKWYDLLIKGMDEDSVNHTITYTCKDLFITELSKNGYNLEFTADLQNNTGTASELVEKVLAGSGWQFDKDNSTVIIQKTEEPVYETTEVIRSFDATQQSPSGDELSTIPAGAELLVFYSQLLNFDSIDYTDLTVQFLYSDEYVTDENDMLVLNGDCFVISGQARKVGGIVEFKVDDESVFTINTVDGVSTRYRAERLVKSWITKYDELFDRYVNVYKDENDNEVWGYSKIEFSDPLAVINLIANPNEFTSLNGWAGHDLVWGVYPKFTNNITNYVGKSYLKVSVGDVYNSGLTANQAFLKPSQGDIKQGNTGGFHVGDKYIFRVKAHQNMNDPSTAPIKYDAISPIISTYEQKKYQVYYLGAKNSFITQPNSIGEVRGYPKNTQVLIPTYQFNDLVSDTGTIIIDILCLSPNYSFITDENNFVLNGASEKAQFNYEINDNEVSLYYRNNLIFKFSLDSISSSYFLKPEELEYLPNNNYFSIVEHTHETLWDEYTLVCDIDKPANEIEQLGLFLHVTEPVWIEDIQFFKYEVGITSYDDTTEHRINPDEMSLQGISKTIYQYYNANHNGAKTAEEVAFLYRGEEQPERFVAQTNNYEKIASIEARNSNRFNILQSIAESFECWVRFTINHDETGRVIFNEEGLPEKHVTLVEYIGTDLGWSFEYGIDLKSIKRKVVSDNIVTKVIVLPNENEFGKNGFCTIARSNLNYSKENFILNLDYYINQGLLDQRTIDRDLYSSSDNYIGYYYFLHKYNTEYDENIQLLSQKKMEYVKQNSQLIVLENQQKATLEKINNNKADLMKLACVTDWTSARNYASSHSDNTKVQTLMNAIAQLQNESTKNVDLIQNLQSSINKLENFINEKTEQQTILVQQIEELHAKFFQKYARYLQEGTWQDSDYIDDDKYYLDAVDVAYTSSRPQIQYSIDVMRLSALTDYAAKTFNVGDICYIQDRDYFGYMKDGITPYKLRIIISEITSYFDQPEKDQIKVQNYKTQFDDLFQRITATTQSLQYAQGGYEKAASVINHDKTLSFDMLQDTFDYNSNLVLNASNQRVTWDETGVTVTDDTNAALQVKLMAGGLFISNDGGASWKNAVRGDGISTDVLTAGRINTSEIYVYDGNHPSFRWDSSGIDAYYYDNSDLVSFNKYIRFDQFGIYGYSGLEDFRPSTEESIWYKTVNNTLVPNPDVRFGLTWKGFFLHGESNSNTGSSGLEIKNEEDSNGVSQIKFLMTGSTTTYDERVESHYDMPVSLEISTDNDIVLKTRSRQVQSGYWDVNRIQIGRLRDINNLDFGIWIRDANGNNIFNVSAEGTDAIGGWNLTKDSFYQTASDNNTIGLFAKGKWWTILNPSSTESDIEKKGNPQEGTGRADNGDSHYYYIIAGNKFGVTIDGEVYAAGGRIGGWNINESSIYYDGTNQFVTLSEDTGAETSGINTYIWPESYGNPVTEKNNTYISYSVYDLSNVNITDEHTYDFYFSVKRQGNYYNKKNCPIVAIITDTNGKYLWSYSDTSSKTITDFNFPYFENAKYLYINYDKSGTNTHDVYYIDDDGETETTTTITGTETSGKYKYLLNIIDSKKTQTINLSNANYQRYTVYKSGLDLRNTLIYISAARTYDLNIYQTLGLVTDASDNIVQIIDNTDINLIRTPVTLVPNAKYLYINYSSGVEVGYYSNNGVIINYDGTLSCTRNNRNLWKIDNKGNAYFEMINAVGGYIAGWHIDSDKIWNDNGTTLSASGNATYNVNKYTIVTNSIAASGGNIGGWNLSSVGLSGGNVTLSPQGIIYFGNGGSKIYTYNTGTVGISPSLHVDGSFTARLSIVSNSNLQAPQLTLISNNPAANQIIVADDLGHFKTVYDDFEVNVSGTWPNGSTDTSRKNYLDWLHKNWGGTTPNQVRVAGINSVEVTNISSAPRTESGEYYYSYEDPLEGTKYVAYITSTAQYYGVDLNSDPIECSTSPKSIDNRVDVTNIFYAGKNSVILGAITEPITDNDTYYASSYGFNGITQFEVSVASGGAGYDEYRAKWMADSYFSEGYDTYDIVDAYLQGRNTGETKWNNVKYTEVVGIPKSEIPGGGGGGSQSIANIYEVNYNSNYTTYRTSWTVQDGIYLYGCFAIVLGDGTTYYIRIGLDGR